MQGSRKCICLGKPDPCLGRLLGFPAEGGWPRGWEVARSPRSSWEPTHSMPRGSPPSFCFVPLAVGRKQFMRFEWANHAAEALGCEYEELNTATFKHHLRQIIEQVTSGPGRRRPEGEETSSGAALLPLWVGQALGTLQHTFTCSSGHTICRSSRCKGSPCGRKWTWVPPARCFWPSSAVQGPEVSAATQQDALGYGGGML